MLRLFAALDLPAAVADGLSRRQTGLAAARWRPREALHVTLRFFGEVAEDVAADLDEALGEISAAPFELGLSGVGAFGEADHMRAVWAGVEAAEPLLQLAARCERAARRAGLKPETRGYRPHVTLAYLPRAADPDRVGAWVQANNLLKAPSFRVDAFGLYSSWPSSGGSRYARERSYPLRRP